MNNVLKYTVYFLVLFFCLFLLQSCKFGRFVYYNFADINDHKIFPYHTAHADSIHFNFYRAADESFPEVVDIAGEDYFFENYLEGNETVAFLIIQNDTIKYERYFDNYLPSSVVPSFSMAKSIISILIGIALSEGYIQSIEEPIITYLPELKKNKGFEKIQIKHLLQMTSGIKFSEGYYNPFGEVASFYYGTNLKKDITKLKVKQAPGESFEYISGNTAILGWILERALGEEHTVTQYLQDKLWQPLGMEYDATWSIDKKNKGLEKAFCCINARAIDFAKIGRLYLNKGKWGNEQIVPKEWVDYSTQIDTTEGSAWYYQNQWWLPSQNGDFLAQGILGQYIYVQPSKNLVVVRLGKKEGKGKWRTLFSELSKYYN